MDPVPPRGGLPWGATGQPPGKATRERRTREPGYAGACGSHQEPNLHAGDLQEASLYRRKRTAILVLARPRAGPGRCGSAGCAAGSGPSRPGVPVPPPGQRPWTDSCQGSQRRRHGHTSLHPPPPGCGGHARRGCSLPGWGGDAGAVPESHGQPGHPGGLHGRQPGSGARHQHRAVRSEHPVPAGPGGCRGPPGGEPDLPGLPLPRPHQPAVRGAGRSCR